MGVQLVTGGIGAGKTCMAVVTIIQAQQGVEITYEDQYQLEHKAIRRVLVAGIKGLVVPHELLPHPLTGHTLNYRAIEEWNREVLVDGKATGQPVHSRLPGEPPVEGIECSLHNWWLWCLPGDLIVCDEVQYMIPRGTLGRSPPHYIKALEVSRHYGVDFVFITQHPQLIDMTLRSLVTLHIHVRSGVGPVCITYSWDHASNVERITHSAKGKFVRRKKYFELYKSTVAVTKQPRPGRTMMIAAVFLLAFGGWRFWSTLHRGQDEAPRVAAVAGSVAGGERGHDTRPIGWRDVPKLSGCYSVGPKCSCQGEDGRPVRVAEEMCRISARGFDGLVAWEPRKPQPGGLAPYGASVAPMAPPGASAPGFSLKTSSAS